MSWTESEYETYSEESFETVKSDVRRKEKKRHSTKGISLDNPIEYRRKSKGQKQKPVDESSEYTEYTDDDDSIGSVSDDSDDNKGKQLSDREKLQQLEAQLAKGKSVQSGKHTGRYPESEESESESEYVTTSEKENIKGKAVNVVQKVNKRIPRSEEDSEETETTGSETEEETETDDEDDYTAFLMKQLATQQLSMENTNTVNGNAPTVENKNECNFGEIEKQVIPNSVDTKGRNEISANTRIEQKVEGDDTSIIEAKVEATEVSNTIPEVRNESDHSAEHKTNDLSENVHGTSEHSSSSKDSQKISHFESNPDIENNLSGDQYKSKDDYSNDANGDEEQKAETGKCENMHEGNGSYNSEVELGFTEAEHMNDKSDKTSMVGPSIDSSDGNKKGEKLNLNSNRTSGKHIDPERDGRDGDCFDVEASHSMNSDPSMDHDNKTGQVASEQQQQNGGQSDSKDSETTISQNGTMDAANTKQSNLETGLNSYTDPANEDKMSLTQSATDLGNKEEKQDTLSSKDDNEEPAAEILAQCRNNDVGNQSDIAPENEGMTENKVTNNNANVDEEGNADASETMAEYSDDKETEVVTGQLDNTSEKGKENQADVNYGHDIDNQVIDAVSKKNSMPTSRGGSKQSMEETTTNEIVENKDIPSQGQQTGGHGDGQDGGASDNDKEKKKSGEINHEKLNDEGLNKNVETPDTEVVIGQLDNTPEIDKENQADVNNGQDIDNHVIDAVSKENSMPTSRRGSKQSTEGTTTNAVVENKDVPNQGQQTGGHVDDQNDGTSDNDKEKKESGEINPEQLNDEGQNEKVEAPYKDDGTKIKSGGPRWKNITKNMMSRDAQENKKTKHKGDRVSQHEKDAEKSDQDLNAEDDADYKEPQEDVTTRTKTKDTKDVEDDSTTIKENDNEPYSNQDNKDEEERDKDSDQSTAVVSKTEQENNKEADMGTNRDVLDSRGKTRKEDTSSPINTLDKDDECTQEKAEENEDPPEKQASQASLKSSEKEEREQLENNFIKNREVSLASAEQKKGPNEDKTSQHCSQGNIERMEKERSPSKTSITSNKPKHSKEVNHENNLDINVDREGEIQVTNNNDERTEMSKIEAMDDQICSYEDKEVDSKEVDIEKKMEKEKSVSRSRASLKRTTSGKSTKSKSSKGKNRDSKSAASSKTSVKRTQSKTSTSGKPVSDEKDVDRKKSVSQSKISLKSEEKGDTNEEKGTGKPVSDEKDVDRKDRMSTSKISLKSQEKGVNGNDNDDKGKDTQASQESPTKESDENKDSDGKVSKSQISLKSADKIKENGTSELEAELKTNDDINEKNCKDTNSSKTSLKQDDEKNTEVKDGVTKSSILEKKFSSVDQSTSSHVKIDQDESKMEQYDQDNVNNVDTKKEEKEVSKSRTSIQSHDKSDLTENNDQTQNKEEKSPQEGSKTSIKSQKDNSCKYDEVKGEKDYSKDPEEQIPSPNEQHSYSSDNVKMEPMKEDVKDVDEGDTSGKIETKEDDTETAKQDSSKTKRKRSTASTTEKTKDNEITKVEADDEKNKEDIKDVQSKKQVEGKSEEDDKESKIDEYKKATTTPENDKRDKDQIEPKMESKDDGITDTKPIVSEVKEPKAKNHEVPKIKINDNEEEPVIASETSLETREPTESDDVQSPPKGKQRVKSNKKKRKKSGSESSKTFGSTASLRSIYDDVEPKKNPMGFVAINDEDDDDGEDDYIDQGEEESKPVKVKVYVKAKTPRKKDNSKEPGAEKNTDRKAVASKVTYKPPVPPKRRPEKGKKKKTETTKETKDDKQDKTGVTPDVGNPRKEEVSKPGKKERRSKESSKDKQDTHEETKKDKTIKETKDDKQDKTGVSPDVENPRKEEVSKPGKKEKLLKESSKDKQDAHEETKKDKTTKETKDNKQDKTGVTSNVEIPRKQDVSKPEKKEKKSKESNKDKRDTQEETKKDTQDDPTSPRKTDNKYERKPKLRLLKLKTLTREPNKDLENEDVDKRDSSPVGKRRRKSTPGLRRNVGGKSTARERRSQTASRTRSPRSPSNITGELGEKIKWFIQIITLSAI